MGRFDKLNSIDANKPKRDAPEAVQVAASTPVGTHVPTNVPANVPTVVAGEIAPYTDIVRKAVRWPGVIAANVRVSKEEDESVKALMRHFEDKGYYLDKTLLLRISLNFMLDDFQRRGDKSYLAEILERINTY